MRARSLTPLRWFATPARELKGRLDSSCLLPLTGVELRCSELQCSEPHPKQQKQIQPQHAHKMPVVGSRVQSAAPQSGPVQFCDHADETTEPSKDVDSMSYGQHIEERIAHIAG